MKPKRLIAISMLEPVEFMSRIEEEEEEEEGDEGLQRKREEIGEEEEEEEELKPGENLEGDVEVSQDPQRDIVDTDLQSQAAGSPTEPEVDEGNSSGEEPLQTSRRKSSLNVVLSF